MVGNNKLDNGCSCGKQMYNIAGYNVNRTVKQLDTKTGGYFWDFFYLKSLLQQSKLTFDHLELFKHQINFPKIMLK